MADTTQATTGNPPPTDSAQQPEPVTNDPIEVDTSSDTDSARGDEISSYTASLTSTVVQYREKYGRRYHAFDEIPYVMPNDDREADRLDMFHHLIKLVCDGRLHYAPIGPDPHRILDLGTGTGIWPVEMGDVYSSAEIIGNDLSAIQPTWVPPRVKFEIDDIREEWPPRPPFDYIHGRYMVGSGLDFPTLLRRSYNNLKPGGWAEFQDWDTQPRSDDGTLTPETYLQKWTSLGTEACVKLGLDPSPGPKLMKWMKDAGFVDIQTRVHKLPLGTWPKDKRLKEIGAWTRLVLMDEGMEAMTMELLTDVLKWSVEEVQVLLAKVRPEVIKSQVHSYYHFHMVWGRKPEEPVKES